MANVDGQIILGLNINATRGQIQAGLNEILQNTGTKQVIIKTAIEKEEAKRSIKSLVDELKDELDKEKVKLDVKIDDKIVQSVLKQQQKIASEQEKLNRQMQEYESIAKSAGLTLDKNILSKFKKAIDTGDLSKAGDAIGSIKKQLDELNRMKSDSAIERNVSSMVDKFNQLKNVSAETQSRVKLLKANLAQYEKADSTNKKLSAYNRLYTLLDQLETEYNQLKTAEKNYANSNDIQNKYKDAKSLYDNLSKMYSTADGKAADGLRSSLQALGNVLSDFEKNSKGLSGGKLAAEWEKVELAVDDAKRSVSKYKVELSSTSKLDSSLKSITDKINKSLSSLSGSKASNGVIKDLKNGYSELAEEAKRLETILNNLDLTNEEEVRKFNVEVEKLISKHKELQAVEQASAKQVSYDQKIASAKSYLEVLKQTYSTLGNSSGAEKLKASIDALDKALSNAAENPTEENMAIEWNNVDKAVQGAVNSVKEYKAEQSSIGKLDNSLTSLTDKINNAMSAIGSSGASGTGVDNLKAKLQGLYNEASQLQTRLADLDPSNGSDVKNLSEDIENLSAKFKNLSGDIKIFGDATEFEKLQAKIQKTQQAVADYAETYSAIKSRPDLVEELKKLQEASKNITNENELKRFNAQFDQFNTKVKAAGLHCKSLGDQFKTAFTNFAQFFSASRLIYEFTNTFKEMVENVKELDKAMIELRKVTDETEEAYESFLTNTKTRAVELGTTVKDLVSATADFSRLGYTLKESTRLGEIATIYANVGDDVGSIDQATTSLISTMKGFGLETEDALSIVDKFNEVGNKFAISSGGIGDALQRSSAALHAAGNDIDQSIALIVAANNVIQDEDVVGNMWKTKFCLCVQKCA